ncbi:MAG: PilZ domain-containing protein [Methylobacter sp.]|nr:PilZ domain-containing protein [Methylobacter sp.]
MTKNKNRRVSFRIYDEVNLFYKKIDEKLVTEPHPVFDNILNDFLSPTDIERRARDSALPKLEKNLPDVTMPGFQFEENDTLNVNISASGMAFNCEDALKEGDYLIIKILLVSTMAVIVTYCKVVYCKNSNPYESQLPYLVGAHFINLKDEDRELLSKHVDKKKVQQIVVKGFILAAVITVIAAPDVVFGFLFDLSHSLLGLFLHSIHITFEFIESTLDHLVEHFFHTNLKQTQIIVFYIMLSFGLYVLYRLWRALPPFCRRCKKNQIAYWLRKKASLLYYWREQSLFNKIKLVVIGAAAITGYIFFGM